MNKTPEIKSERKLKYEAYIKSPEWYELKLDLLAKRGCKCEKCSKPKPAQVLQIHHLTYDRLYNEQAADLEILCPICHMKTHGLIKEKNNRPHVKHKKPKRNKKPKVDYNNLGVSQREKQEVSANGKFTAAKRRRMKGKGTAAWQQ
jgi:5-methylcytosine-specific restriction endonuclease McrA